MGLVIIPIGIACGCTSIGFAAWKARERLATCFQSILPNVVLAKVAIKDDEGNKKDKHEIKDNLTLKEENEHHRKAEELMLENGIPQSKEFQLRVLIECALHLPVMDVPIQDRAFVGSCDPYVKILVAGQEVTTHVQYGTLYPVFDQEFTFYVNRDIPRRRPQLITLEVWDWDLGKRDDFCGATSLSLTTLIEAYQKRTDRGSAFSDCYRVPLHWANGKAVRDLTNRTNHKAGRAPSSS